MKHVFLFAILFTLVSCMDETLTTPSDEQALQAQKHIEATEADVAAAEQKIEQFEAAWIDFRNPVIVPAGSVDALAGAIEEAGTGGTVVLASGDHTENQTLVINTRVRIVGEADVNLIFPNVNPPMDIPKEIVPAIHIRDASRVWLRNFTISTGSSEASRYGVVIQDAPQTRLQKLTITGFQDGILIDGGDESQILNNTLIGVLDQFPDLVLWGIANSTGQDVTIFNNNVSNFAVGIFFSDANGLAYSNIVSGGTIGFIWCTVPAWQNYPNGDFVSAASPANAWVGFRNTVASSVFNYLIIDGATNSVAIQNSSIDAILYDYEIAGESERFGFITPTSSNSLVVANGAVSDVNIKDCTGDNTIIGGNLVDTAVDPCF